MFDTPGYSNRRRVNVYVITIFPFPDHMKEIKIEGVSFKHVVVIDLDIASFQKKD